MRMNLPYLLRSSVLAVACVSLNACAQEVVPSIPLLKTECVGRYQLSLPAAVDIAVHPLRIPSSEDYSSRDPAFADASVASDSGFSYEGVIYVGAVTSLGYFAKFTSGHTSPPGKNSRVNFFKNGFKIDWPRGSSAYLYRESRIYGFESNGQDNQSLYKSHREYFLANFFPRPVFKLPVQQGICFPYGFIKDDGSKPHYVSVAMRLLDHPDVEIVFMEANAQKESPDRLSEYKGSRGHVQNFWSFYEPSQGNKLDGTINHYHDVSLGGFPGKYATATIARPLDSADTTGDRENQEQYSTRIKREMAEGKYPLDYGYMAYYKGDPNKPGEPDLKLSVIRTASRAIKAGKTPVTQEELYEMAKKIAASVKRRPIQ